MHISTTTSLVKTCGYEWGCGSGYSQAQGQKEWRLSQGGRSSLKETVTNKTVTFGIKDIVSANTRLSELCDRGNKASIYRGPLLSVPSIQAFGGQ